MRLRIICFALCAGLFSAATALHAAEALTPGETVGKWTFSMSESGSDLKKISGGTVNKIRGSLQDMTRLITATPVMAPPTGFEVRFWGVISGKDKYDLCTGKSCPPTRPTAALAMMIGQYEVRDDKLKAAFNSPATMDISTNNLGHLFAHLPVLARDADGYLLPEPVMDGERAGMPTYLNNGHAVAVAARNSQPLWLPVNRARYLKAELAVVANELALPGATAKKGRKGKNSPEIKLQSGKPILVDTSRVWGDPADGKTMEERSRSLTDGIKVASDALKEQYRQLQAEIEALTPAQGAMQARVDLSSATDGQRPTLLPVDSSAGVAVVTPNFRYFNPKLPPEVIQLLVVQWKFAGDSLFDPEKTGEAAALNNRALLEIYRSMDWNRLRLKVTQTAP